MDESDPIPVFKASSDIVGGADSLEIFRGSVQDVFETRLADSIAPRDFQFDMTAAHLGRLLISQVRASALTFERGRRLVATAGIDHILVQLYTSGGFAGLIGGEDRRVRAGDICFLDLTRTLDTKAADFGNINLVIPRALLADALVDIDQLHGLVLPRDQPLTKILAAHLRALIDQAVALPPSDADLVGRGTIALIARLVEGRSGVGGATQPQATTLKRMLDFIDANVHDTTLGPAQLIERFGVSRAKLYRMFDGVGGIAEVIRMRRLSGAAMQLASTTGPKRRVSEVARAWGFSDDTSFGRAFRAHYGITPREARTRSGEIWSRIQRASHQDDPDGTEVALWFRTLRT